MRPFLLCVFLACGAPMTAPDSGAGGGAGGGSSETDAGPSINCEPHHTLCAFGIVYECTLSGHDAFPQNYCGSDGIHGSGTCSETPCDAGVQVAVGDVYCCDALTP